MFFNTYYKDIGLSLYIFIGSINACYRNGVLIMQVTMFVVFLILAAILVIVIERHCMKILTNRSSEETSNDDSVQL